MTPLQLLFQLIEAIKVDDKEKARLKAIVAKD